ncbi:hypothetical protein SLUN_00825 [Streptomyces lunaelactis]|uniref:Uncharacterized protein n=1 Tax=Streptomyces lunaelactis TaxID=1535768 RepID=A0A2R4SVU3_9ACTN|nr:hypothetical protein [Streptomyces lunaelactis]AVZ71013.1 hypothetical protein SLUN_00825 [Streptomyces lunaelactis]NUK28500.1 hypothetical protein [Streptomyces lunaelactis]NUK86065.1 hypothetical protein [Streptomyces lunaelactis]
MTEQPVPSQSTTTWICPLHPFGHRWDDTALTCSLCGTQRTASDAVVSLLSGLTGWDTARAEQLVGQGRAELLNETADALTGRHCSPESVSVVRRLVDERLCGDCKGYGQVFEIADNGGVCATSREFP